jgi:tRNA dimethylallyltransferase
LNSVPIELSGDELLCVVGPTASGKTDLAIRLCEPIGGEVISADSVQIYRHFDLGSGKPSAEQRARVPHHMVDALEPTDAVDAARFAELADEAIGQLRLCGKKAVVCGGTFLWIRALVFGLAKAPAADRCLREEIRKEALAHGVEALHARLAQVDPQAAARLAPRDYVRVERALEVYRLTGKPISELHREHQQQPPRYKARFVGIRWDPKQLERRIAIRAQAWLQEGWEDEVRKLLAMGFRDTRAMGSVGYRQVLDHLDGRVSREQLLDSVVRATKIFARRQRTWLRRVPVLWIEPQ